MRGIEPVKNRAKRLGTGVQVGLVIVLGILLVAAVGAYALDQSRSDQIADGVRIGDVDVGGLSAREARSQVRRDLVSPLKKPIKVEYGGEDYALSPEQLRVRADIDGMVQEAVEQSREGGFFARTWRTISGGETDAEVEPRINYSSDALSGFLAGVADKVNRDPVDASVDPTPTDLTPVPAQKGVTVRGDELRQRVEQALQSSGSRVVEAPVDTVKPDVTTDEVASRYPTYITIDRDSFRLRLFKNLKLDKEYTIAVGAVGYDTPSGLYTIQSKEVNPTWHVPDSKWAGDLAGRDIPPGPDNPLKARWMGLIDGAGIHGTSESDSLGSAASHGCIRMAVPDVIDLFDRVDVGTPTYIF